MTSISLFEFGQFILHSGELSTWRINAEALDDASIEAIAYLACTIVGKFGSVEGVPTGGLRLAEAMRPMVTTGPLLIVDDVLTTGNSIKKHLAGRDAKCFVIFDRSGGGHREWVKAFLEVKG